MFQLLLAVGAAFVNLFWMAALLRSKQTRKQDYYLLFLQNLVDFIFSGVYNSVYSVLILLSQLNEFCLTQFKYDRARELIELFTGHREYLNLFSMNSVQEKRPKRSNESKIY